MTMPQQPPRGYQGPPPQGGPPQGPPSHGPSSQVPPHQNPHPGPPPTQQFQPTQYGQPLPPAQQPRQPMPKAMAAVWTFGLISVAATVIGLSISENGANAWHTVHAWGVLAIVGAVLTLAPAFGTSPRLTPHRAWQAAVCGAALVGLFWVLFVLPAVGSNLSLVLTVGAAAGMIAAWVAPGREVGGAPDHEQQHTW